MDQAIFPKFWVRRFPVKLNCRMKLFLFPKSKGELKFTYPVVI